MLESVQVGSTGARSPDLTLAEGCSGTLIVSPGFDGAVRARLHHTLRLGRRLGGGFGCPQLLTPLVRLGFRPGPIVELHQ
jgi:hypothetical protein